ncbi:FAD-dependent monooxygenase [Actinoplanes sp. KI2]|uniref:FAD-dependent oxidoreductase n=1 Tax=Actinoplanes sp. KI2 TaxID=2983315 RepID=UPI0021D614E9|nr:NAD(P)/FAD-dependent oxidoreductase [Actinoplanes sp. KI2]MCU7726301.1 FAD-dependent monooxygenase [Actinoplanes sp. KI2]
MRVAIAGAGLGGLCLAQGLVRAGVDVQVYERDAGLAARRQGYRLHMDARAGLSLQKCLPPRLFRLFLATTGRPGTKVTVLSAQLRVLHETPGGPDRDPDDPATLSTSADRGTLREILAAGLADRIRYGRELAGHDQDAGGVTLRFADGSAERADVLVGADGVGSVVRRALLPEARLVDTGARVIYGKTLLDGAARRLVPAAMHNGFTAVTGGHLGLATGLVEFRRSPSDAAAALAPGVRLSPAADYLMWGLSAQHDRLPAADSELAGADAATLHATACRAIRTWHPDLRALLAGAAVDETFFIRVRSSRRVPAWPPSRVTLLGDAIHAMSPARGSGANTALMDAANLCAALTGGTDLVPAIGGYEQSMREYGFAAVDASRQAEAETARRGSSPWLWLVNHWPRPRRTAGR